MTRVLAPPPAPPSTSITNPQQSCRFPARTPRPRLSQGSGWDIVSACQRNRGVFMARNLQPNHVRRAAFLAGTAFFASVSLAAPASAQTDTGAAAAAGQDENEIVVTASKR